MGSVGDAHDNALCESFFATLECELLDRECFRTQADARLAVFDFIEGWYNPRRRHSALDSVAQDFRTIAGARRSHSALRSGDRPGRYYLSIPLGGGTVTISKQFTLRQTGATPLLKDDASGIGPSY